ncbi:conserved hypothetical protein [Xanthomonas phaseoli pv. phaseoli]|uniref:Uncharacterized protein n=1 Tax=Xanthomonas campestris pv. phaseoli TaxID=317013 RepID=A0A7Z7J5R0_XANCH|nr:conserved hypothetical protein [Xanthomonas phaseoli pv. phaseoli]
MQHAALRASPALTLAWFGRVRCEAATHTAGRHQLRGSTQQPHRTSGAGRSRGRARGLATHSRLFAAGSAAMQWHAVSAMRIIGR